MERAARAELTSGPIHVNVADTLLEGAWDSPPQPRGVVLFPHGRGTGRGANDALFASKLRAAGLATLLLDLLSSREVDLDERKAAFRFDMALLTDRLAGATDWLAEQPATLGLPIGYFGVGYAAEVATRAATKRSNLVRAVVTHDALTDLADQPLPRVPVPTLIISGISQLPSSKSDGPVIPYGPGPSVTVAQKPEEVARLAAEWFSKHLGP
ncbi:MAG TPA: hypothetical protein VNX28_01140 [Gemmataceae bacterium]|jgi:putative phosphoribosyl transferase|nr:hypothetical protein [Gemmataceae bacterium]